MSIGACIFCGQINSESYGVEYESQDHANECATFKCECDDAKFYTRRKQELQRADASIEDLFGEGAVEYGLVSIKHEVRELMMISATHIYDDVFKSVSIDIASGAKVKISKSAKGNLTFVRSAAVVFRKEV